MLNVEGDLDRVRRVLGLVVGRVYSEVGCLVGGGKLVCHIHSSPNPPLERASSRALVLVNK